MTFTIITQVPHFEEQNYYYSYAPYIREMNVWIKYAERVIIVAPISHSHLSPIEAPYDHCNITFQAIKRFNVLNLISIIKTLWNLPLICWTIFGAMQKADHIHLRCPGNIGLMGCIIQILFPNKQKTAKYAGNWDPKSKQPCSYRLQKWILSNTFLTRNMQVLVYGEWRGVSSNIKPFFTASYSEIDKKEVTIRKLQNKIQFVFVGTLVSGKNPLYAIKLVESLYRKGYDVALNLYGEGDQNNFLEKYISQNNLSLIISTKGNQNQEIVKNAFRESHFVILPSESEGWPKVVAEGMFWGCVPAATAVSCIPTMLDYGNRGIILSLDLNNDVSQFERLIHQQTEYSLKAQKAVSWSREYTMDLFENEIRKLLLL